MHDTPEPDGHQRPDLLAACGWCGAIVGAGVRCIDFCTEAHQLAWHRRHAGLPPLDALPPVHIVIPPALSDEAIAAFRHLAEQLRRALTEQLAPAMRAITEAARPLIQAAERAGLIDKPVPSDPMARALHLRRTRNTGPITGHRPPRRIDPTRTRR